MDRSTKKEKKNQITKDGLMGWGHFVVLVISVINQKDDNQASNDLPKKTNYTYYKINHT